MQIPEATRVHVVTLATVASAGMGPNSQVFRKLSPLVNKAHCLVMMLLLNLVLLCPQNVSTGLSLWPYLAFKRHGLGLLRGHLR